MATIFRPTYATRIHVRPYTAALTDQGPSRLALTSTASAAPFAQIQWPNPQGRAFPVALRTHTNPFPVNLYGKDQFFAAPGEAPRYDYPNPRLRQVQQPQGTASGLALTAAPAASPFTPRDWPNPRLRVGPQVGVQFRSGALDVTPQQSDVLRIPYQVRIWPRNPQAAIGAQEGVRNNRLALTTVVGAAPFAQTDWQNPQVRRVQQPLNLPVLLQLYADGAGINGAYNEYLNPIVRRVQQPQDFQGSLALTAPAAGPSPFAQNDWQNPLSRRVQQPQANPSGLPAAFATPSVLQAIEPAPRQRRAQQPDSPPLSLALAQTLAGQPITPGDWPNPQRRRPQQPEYPPTGLPAIFAKPLVAQSFEMPVRRPAPRYDFRHTTFAAFIVVPPKPFLQSDWPNPLRRPFPFTSASATLLPPTDIPEHHFWTPVASASGSWSAAAGNSTTWTPASPAADTWTRVSDDAP